MLRIIVIGILVILALLGLAWYGMQSLPSWFDESQTKEQQAIEALSEQIRRQGVESFLGGKLDDILRGEVILNDAEFTALLIASLQADEDGRKLLQVSDAVRVFIHDNEVEVAAIINLDKVEQVNPKARKTVEKFDRMFFFLKDNRLALSVFGTPVARSGKIGIKDDFHLKVGAIPITNNTLRQLGVDVQRAEQENLLLKLLRVQSIALNKGQIQLSVRPRL